MLDLTAAAPPRFPPPPASALRRLTASIIDGLTILLPALMITVGLASIIEDNYLPFDMISRDLLKMIFTVIGTASAGVLISLPALLSRVNNGITLGHVITSTRMVRLDGERLQISNVVRRWGLGGGLPIALMFISTRLSFIAFLWFVLDAIWPVLTSISPDIGRRNLRDYLSGLQVVAAATAPLPGPDLNYGAFLTPLRAKSGRSKANSPYQALPPAKTPNGFYPVADGNYRLFFEGIWWSSQVDGRSMPVSIALYTLWNLLVTVLSFPLFLIAPVLSIIFLIREKLRGRPSSELTTEGIKPTPSRSIIGPVLLTAAVALLAAASLILFLQVLKNPNLLRPDPVAEKAKKEKFISRVPEVERLAVPGRFLAGFGSTLYGCSNLEATDFYEENCRELLDAPEIHFWGRDSGFKDHAPRGTKNQLEMEAENVWGDCRAYIFQNSAGQRIGSRLDCDR